MSLALSHFALQIVSRQGYKWSLPAMESISAGPLVSTRYKHKSMRNSWGESQAAKSKNCILSLFSLSLPLSLSLCSKVARVLTHRHWLEQCSVVICTHGFLLAATDTHRNRRWSVCVPVYITWVYKMAQVTVVSVFTSIYEQAICLLNSSSAVKEPCELQCALIASIILLSFLFSSLFLYRDTVTTGYE